MRITLINRTQALKRLVMSRKDKDEKLHALETQLYVFEEALEEDVGPEGLSLSLFLFAFSLVLACDQLCDHCYDECRSS
jgi:hypothetical protein